MSIKQKLEWGIYPIASRRHQPRDNYNTFHKIHIWTPDEGILILSAWLLTPITAAIGMAISGGRFSYGESLILVMFLNFVLTVLVKTS